ncbi:MAG: ParB/RepB/Spo0J family partition protein, partial [Alphaproteobacteria bacterium]|nr:ParB/RepB/Spo0J family partition protein [Alphaproteobacteria bacterium]
MNSIHHGWSLDEIAPEARRAAERAAEAAGMPLEIWLNQLIKYVSAMELSGKGPARARAIDETIKRAAAEQARMGAVDGPADSGPDAPTMLDPAPTEHPTTLPAEVLQPNRFAEEQPGERDIEQAIGEWRKSGALAPLVVRPDTRRPGHYEIVNGMERWHAASRLHMRRIPVTVRELTDEEVLRATLIQKLALKSLPPLDEAQIYQRLMEETGLSVAALSDVIGRSPTHVATALQLLELPQPVREMIN